MRKLLPHLLIFAALSLPLTVQMSVQADSHTDAVEAADPAEAYENVPWTHAIHMFNGDPLYPVDYRHWNYVNPDAPRTGELKLGSFGSFTTLTYNLNSNGDQAPGITASLYNSLLTSNADEIDTSYGELAGQIKLPPSRNWVAFKIREEAKWPNGEPVTPNDVIFTWERSREQGGPTFKTAFEMVTSIENKGDGVVLFTLDPERDNRETFLAIGGQEILPQYYWANRDMSETTLDAPVGSGPYMISDLKAGQFIEYKLRPDYWAMDLPFNRGLSNYETIRYTMYKERDVMRLALIAGDIDYLAENTAKAWAKSYEDIEAIDAGVLKKQWFDDPGIMDLVGAFYNTKLEKFQDRRVREALGLAFNFEWTNKTMFFGQYERIHSHFQNSFLEAKGLPEGYELEVLEELRGQVPDSVFEEPHRYAETDGTLNNRDQLRAAARLLAEAGYKLGDDRILAKDGKQLSVDLVIRSPEFERLVLPWMDNLKKNRCRCKCAPARSHPVLGEADRQGL